MASNNSYTCNRCKKTFATLGRYNQHIKLHSKPWTCEHCDKRFGLRADLHRHVKSQHRVGNVKFSCTMDGCTFKATRKDNVPQHLRKFHGIKNKTPRCRQDKSPARDAAKEPIRSNSESETPPKLTWVDLMEAASLGNVSKLQNVLNAGVDVNTQADDGFTAVHCAARSGQMEALCFLLEAKAQRGTLKPDSSYYSIILESIQGKSLECCKLLLDTSTGSELMTEIVRRVQRETETIPSSPWSFKALANHVVRCDDLKIAEYIFDSIPLSEDTEREDQARLDFGYLLASTAARDGRVHILRLLETICPAVLSGDRASQKLYRASREMPVYAAASRGHTACVRLLLPHLRKDHNWLPTPGSNRVPAGFFAFRAAAENGSADVVRAFLEAEPRLQVNMSDRFGRTVLHDAIQTGGLETVKALLQCPRIDTSLTNKFGDRPLYLAAQANSLKIVEALLEHGARDKKALFITFWSWEQSRPVAQLIIKYIAQDFTPIDEKAIATRAQLAELLFNARGYRYKDVAYMGIFYGRKYLLPLAVEENDVDLLQVLLGLDSISPDDLDEKIYGRSFWTISCYRTPLNYARNRGYTEIAGLLSARGAIDDFWDPDGTLAAYGRDQALEVAAKAAIPTYPAQEQSAQTQQETVDIDSEDAEMDDSDEDDERM